MKRISFNNRDGKATVQVDSAQRSTTYVLSPHTDPGDREIWRRLNDAAKGKVEYAQENLRIVELEGIGRAATLSEDQGAILFERHMREDEFNRIVRGPDGDPICCPYCGEKEVSFVNSITVVVTSNEMEPGDRSSSMDLDEYQCRGVCEGRSFWV